MFLISGQWKINTCDGMLRRFIYWTPAIVESLVTEGTPAMAENLSRNVYYIYDLTLLPYSDKVDNHNKVIRLQIFIDLFFY